MPIKILRIKGGVMKRAAVVIYLFFMASALFASGNFEIWAGYSSHGLDGVNSRINSLCVDYGASSKNTVLGGITAGLDGAYWYYTWWGIGGRISHTRIFEGYAEGQEAGLDVKTVFSGSFCRVLAGVPLLFEFFDGKMSVGGGLYCGWGYASIGETKTGGSGSGSYKAGAHCFVFEAPLRLSYHFSSSFLLDALLSYSYADAGKLEVYDTAGAELSGMVKGSPTAYSADFSGITIGLGFNWRYSSAHWPWYN